MTVKRLLALTFCAACLTGGSPPDVAARVTAAGESTPAASWHYPQRRTLGAFEVVLHAPQIHAWPDFERFTGLVAIEFHPDAGAAPIYGTLAVSGATQVDLPHRLVYVTNPQVDAVMFPRDGRPEYEDALRDGVRKGRLEVPLDVFLLSLDEDVLAQSTPEGFSVTPPRIVVAETPTIVLFVNGAPVRSPLAETGLDLVVNANWPVVAVRDGGACYLLNRDLWLTAAALEGPWTATRALPGGLSRLDAAGEHAAIAAAVPAPETDQPTPRVHVAKLPTELIVTDGAPILEPIEAAEGLSYVSNTRSPLLWLDSHWYFLVAGRWFATSDLESGPWTFVTSPPAVFADIPADHELGWVRASVPGTLEARVAALEALLPTRKQAPAGNPAPVTVAYSGEPKFEPIGKTGVKRAVNTGYDVLEYQGTYYLCYAGAWYAAASPAGPWTATTDVPAAVYAIPPSSPAYPVTQVKVVSSTPSTVTYTYTPAYTSSVYVVSGVPVYGTGYYYPPYVYGDVYYPYQGAYGHANYYNPSTGTYGSRSVYCGPYGGYSYTEGYNPSTGRYGYAETAWDSDEWASHSQTYNPRTGIESQTDRYANAASDRTEMERTLSRGDQWVQTERQTDWDQHTSSTERSTSRGGSSEVTREWDEGGVSRSGTASKGGESISGSTERTGATTRSEFETSAGGSGKSVSHGVDRTTAVETASGDVYAGHDGNVYKKTDDGWQRYNPSSGGWDSRPGGETRVMPSARHSWPSGGAQYGSRDLSRLDRDAAARRGGFSSFHSRRFGGGYSRGGGHRPSRSRGGMRRR